MKKVLLVSLMLILSIFITSCGEDKVEEKKIEIKKQQQEQSANIADEISNSTKEISDKLASGEITDEQAEKMMLDSLDNSETAKSQLELQKEQMPKLFELIKKQESCIKDADDKDDFMDCIEESKKMARAMGISEIYMDDEDDEELKDLVWDEAEKEKTLKEMSEGLAEMENVLPCLKEAKVMTDLMKCYEGMK